MSNCDCQQYQKQFGVSMQNTIAIVGANSGKNTNANKEKLGKIVEATPQLNCCRMETQGLYKGEMFLSRILPPTHFKNLVSFPRYVYLNKKCWYKQICNSKSWLLFSGYFGPLFIRPHQWNIIAVGLNLVENPGWVPPKGQLH